MGHPSSEIAAVAVQPISKREKFLSTHLSRAGTGYWGYASSECCHSQMAGRRKLIFPKKTMEEIVRQQKSIKW